MLKVSYSYSIRSYTEPLGSRRRIFGVHCKKATMEYEQNSVMSLRKHEIHHIIRQQNRE